MERLKAFIKYAPMAWIFIKLAWSIYRAKIKQEGYRDALKTEQHKRVAAEARLALNRRLADDDATRLERLRREAADRE